MPQFGLRDNLIRCELLKNEEQYTYLEDFRYFTSTHYGSLKSYFNLVIFCLMFEVAYRKISHNLIFHCCPKYFFWSSISKSGKTAGKKNSRIFNGPSSLFSLYWITMTPVTENLCKMQFIVWKSANIWLFVATPRGRLMKQLGPFVLNYISLLLFWKFTIHHIFFQLLSGYLQCQWADTKGKPSPLAELHSQPSWCVLCWVGDHFSATE